MNRRLNLFFWMFAMMMCAEHLAALITGVREEPKMTGAALAISFAGYVIFECISPKISDLKHERQLADRARREYVRTALANPVPRPVHQHRWVHQYDTDGYYADDPYRHVPSRVYRCRDCLEIRRATGIQHYRGGHDD